MAQFSRYVLSVISAGLVIGILRELAGKNGSIGGIIRVICGLFLTFTIIAPVSRLDFSSIDLFIREYSLEGAHYSAQGEADADRTYQAIIKEQTEAYILDKAQSLQVKIQADVTLDESDVPVPVFVCLSGDVSPYAKQQLEVMLEEELGIAKENQKWIGKVR